MILSRNNDLLYGRFSSLSHSSPHNPLYTHTHTQTPEPLPCSPITSQFHVLHSIVIVCLCELFPLHNICKLWIRCSHCEEKKCRLQITRAVNKESALKCMEWPEWKQQYLQTVYCGDAMMSSELQQPEDRSKTGSQAFGQAQPIVFYLLFALCCF